MKKLMMLGGNFFQMSAIIKAKELGYYVITVDYLPDNPGHKYSDEYHNISTVNKEEVLALAQKLKIDGILSYASDVSAPTAAYVAEKMNLPGNPYDSVMILTHKDMFRDFMNKNHLIMPKGRSFNDRSEARRYFDSMELPLIIKPIDSSGSKGVARITDRAAFDKAFDEAMSYSLSGNIIIEQFIAKNGYQIDGDGFLKDGKIVFFGVMDQHNNVKRNPHAPIGLSYPSIQDEIHRKKAYDLIRTIFTKLDMKFCGFNFEYIIGDDGEVYILEVAPRNGGNLIPDTIEYATGVDMIEASIRASVGDDYSDVLIPKKNLAASSYVIHSLTDGKFKELRIHDEIKSSIVKQILMVSEGDEVKAFRNGGDSIGAMVISFDTVEQMDEMMDKMWEYVEVITEQ